MGTEFWNGAQAAHRRVMMKAAGYSFRQVIDRILELALEQRAETV